MLHTQRHTKIRNFGYRDGNKCANYCCKWTILVQLVIKDVVKFYFGTQCRPICCWSDQKSDGMFTITVHFFGRGRSLSIHVNFGTYNFCTWVFGAVNFGTLNVNFGTCHVRYMTDQLWYIQLRWRISLVAVRCLRFATQPSWLVTPEGLRWRKESTGSLYRDPLLLPLFISVFTLLCLLLDL